MTVIAWDGRTLAADRRCGTSYPRSVTKILKLMSGELIGVTGWIDRGIALIDWYVAGADRLKLPDWQRNENTCCELMIIKPDRTIWVIGEFGIPWQVENGSHAIGSGRDFGAAAMHLGCDARKAVDVAIALSATCGNGIDTLTFGP